MKTKEKKMKKLFIRVFFCRAEGKLNEKFKFKYKWTSTVSCNQPMSIKLIMCIYLGFCTDRLSDEFFQIFFLHHYSVFVWGKKNKKKINFSMKQNGDNYLSHEYFFVQILFVLENNILSILIIGNWIIFSLMSNEPFIVYWSSQSIYCRFPQQPASKLSCVCGQHG